MKIPAVFRKLAILSVSVLFLFTSCGKKVKIVSDQKSEYYIILPSHADKNELKAASLIQRFVEKSTTYKLPIMRDREQPGEFEICIGKTNRLPEADYYSETLDEAGYRLVSDNSKLFIWGGSTKGTLYGASSFLEDFLGARVYSSSVSDVPELKNFSVPKNINIEYNPPIKFRTTHYRDTWNLPYAEWHKLSHKKDGGHPDWGYWCHSFNTLVPPGEYFEDHPEYYAEIKGNRVPTQLCLTNEDVFRITLENLRKAVEEKPELTYWSVSQNDNVSYCQCEECRKLDEAEETPMGSLLVFVNRLAKEFPDKVISTLAYQYSRKAPKTIVPEENVNIMLCTIELNRSKPISTDEGAASFRTDLENWAKLTDDILLWDYVIQFENLVSPFPNLRVLQPNLQYFVENHADKHFQQGNREIGGEFAELRAYLISKLLWDPYIDVDEVMDDFLSGYYKEGGKFIRMYIDKIHDELEASGQQLNIFGHPSGAASTWLSPDLMDLYESYFDKAEKAVADQPEVLERVKVARMPLQYAKIEIALRLGTAEGGMYVKEESGKWHVRKEIPETAKDLVSRAIDHGFTRFKEWHTTPAEYLLSLERTWEIDMQDHLAYGKPVSLTNQASPKYAAGNEELLTDGLRGPRLTYSYNWLGFEGIECIAEVNLGNVLEVKELSSSWLQDSRSWVFLPEKVSYFGSDDGTSWKLLGELVNEIDQDQPSVNVEDFTLVIDPPVKTSFIKIETESFISCPDWHPGSGSPAWIFIDEIVVK